LLGFIAAMLILELSGQIDIKRVLFLTPWLFIAMGLATFGSDSHFRKLASCAVAVIISCGWIGIASGRHYATANLTEPWGKVAQMVARDAEHGATIISENPSFFIYLNYQLGLESQSENAEGSYLGEVIYRSHGYKILYPFEWQSGDERLRGKLVLVKGMGNKEDIRLENALNDELGLHCKTLGEYRVASDPAASWKGRLSKQVQVLAYRTDVIWYDCSEDGK
jgi:hypothetical protein